jgi:hypothetical protein
MSDQKDALKEELMRPIGPPRPGEVTWYRNANGTYTVAAVVVGILGIGLALYSVY